jgi:lambda repressor-like predicted transcriptional regulator
MNTSIINKIFYEYFHNFFSIFRFTYEKTLYLPKIGHAMTLRIKEVAKSKGMTMAQIAEKIGITPITLSQSLNGNPTLSRLQEVADALGVDVSELFAQSKAGEEIHGCIFIDGSPVVVNSKEDLLKLVKSLE